MIDKKLIFVIDDEINIQLTLFHILTHAGFQVVTLMNNQDSIKKVLTASVDMIIIDFDMECKEGLALLTEIRRGFGEIPIIIMTRRLSNDLLNYSRLLGSCELVVKPLNPEKIMEVVKNLIGRQKSISHQLPEQSF